MYRYDEFDRQFVLQRTAQFADQVQRRARAKCRRALSAAAARSVSPTSASALFRLSTLPRM